MSKIYPSNIAASSRINSTPSKVVTIPSSGVNSNTAKGATKKTASAKAVGPGPSKRRPVSFLDRLLDGLYFLCPDCSLVQCSAIMLGLLMASILTVIFLYIGNYWSSLEPRPAVGTRLMN